MTLNPFLVLESKLVCEVLLCTALPVKYCFVFLIAYPRIRPRSSYASMLACLGGVLYKWNSKKGNHINDITDFFLPNVRILKKKKFSSEKCPIIFEAYNSQLVYMGKVIHSLQHVSHFTTVHNRHCSDPEFHFSTYIAFNKSLFFLKRNWNTWLKLGKAKTLCVFYSQFSVWD